MPETSWTILLPVKRLDAAKTRLGGRLPRRELALSFALDTATAALECPAVARVLVVTCDRDVTKAVTSVGAHTWDDQGDDLNLALRRAATSLDDGSVVVLTADLPAVRAEELSAALRSSDSRPRAFIADTRGTGTVLLTAESPGSLAPRFGPDSARAHESAGAFRLPARWPSLARDVDSPSDLAEAARLGVGPHTAKTLTADGYTWRE